MSFFYLRVIFKHYAEGREVPTILFLFLLLRSNKPVAYALKIICSYNWFLNYNSYWEACTTCRSLCNQQQ